MNRTIRFNVLVCLFLFVFFESSALASDVAKAPLRWGQSMQEVIRNQRIESYTNEDSKSPLSGLDVHTLMTTGLFCGNDSNILYSFRNDKLIECCISIDMKNSSLIEDSYEEIKNFLQSTYMPYKGVHFAGVEDRFVDKNMRTCILLLQDERVLIYLMEFKSVISTMRNRETRNQNDLKKLVIH